MYNTQEHNKFIYTFRQEYNILNKKTEKEQVIIKKKLVLMDFYYWS
jgi:hypothetical protein